jgi:hypothetical protein
MPFRPFSTRPASRNSSTAKTSPDPSLRGLSPLISSTFAVSCGSWR